jgi:Domain of unknown function (DUF4328)
MDQREVAAGWRDPEGPARWVRGLLVVFVVVALASITAILRLGLLAGGAASEADPGRLEGAQVVAGILFGAQAAVMLALLVEFVVWTYRLAGNHVALTRPGTRFGTPGWAVGAWLVWFVLPFFVVRELWKGADPGVPEGSPAWRTVPTSPLVPVWFAAFVLGTLVTNATNALLASSSRDDPDLLRTLAVWRGGATALLVLAAAVLHRLTARLTARQAAAIGAV